MHVAHALLRPEAIEDRPFQKALADKAIEAPHLVVLPTGLGKTVVALRAALHFLGTEPEKHVLLLAPTKPLCDQHARFLRQALPSVNVAVFTGDTAPADRARKWAASRIVVATPQVVQNDLLRSAQDLADVSFLIFDEAHRATGNYPYVFVARRYRAAGRRAALGLTASPGNDRDALTTVLRNLNLERVEIRTERDADVAPFVHEVAAEWIRVRQTEHGARLVRLLERMYGRGIVALRRLGYFSTMRGLPGRKELLRLGQGLRQETSTRNATRSTFEAVSIQARALKLQHALELAETQGSPQSFRFLERVQQESSVLGASKASRDIVAEPEFAEALATARDDPEPPPKTARAVGLVREGLARGARRVLIFANFRETADGLVAALAHEPGVQASRFVGHARAAGEPGLTRRQQEAIVERFRSGELNVLVATAVGEEGLDLPETDLVILHEPVPSAIRLVQRRGRTGRREPGRLAVLITEGTRDETYHWNAVRRERKMLESLAALKRTPPLVLADTRPSPPLRVPAAGLEITVDSREGNSSLAAELLERGFRLRSATLPTGDYAVSERVLVERKSAADFAASIKDGRLFEQLPRLARSGCGVLLIEGDPFRESGGLAPAAIAGAIAAAAADHRVSIVTVPDATTGADIITSLARRERQDGRNHALRHNKPPLALDGQLRYLVEGLPHVGPVTSHNLLQRYGSVAALAAADVEDLAETSGVGPETARAVHELLHRVYAAVPSPVPVPQIERGVPALEGSDGAAR